MSRWQFYGPRDTPDTPDEDTAFTGIDSTRQKPVVQRGMLSYGQNTRMVDGAVRQRPGTTIPQDFNPIGGFPNTLVGSGVFSNPNANELLMVAPANTSYVYALADAKDPYKVQLDPSLDSANTGSSFLTFGQSFDKCLGLRFPSIQNNMVWDGTGDNNHDGFADSNFLPITLSAVASNGSSKVIPDGMWNAEPIGNRIAYYRPNSPSPPWRDQWVISDIEDYTAYDDIFQNFRTNSGTSDYITRIINYFNNGTVIFKNRSIYMATFNPTYPLTISQRVVSSQFGSTGTNLPLMIGGDIIFLAPNFGFYRLSEVDEQNTNVLPLPISEPIQSTIDNLNWTSTGVFGSSAALGRFAFFGVATGVNPLGLNQILVYDTMSRQWHSIDTWADTQFAFHRLHVTTYNGVKRLFAVDYIHSIVYLLYEGVEDQGLNGLFPVPFKIETRGYAGADPQAFKRYGRAMVSIATFDPKITVTAITDGFNEEFVLTNPPLTRNRLRYYTHGKANFDPTTDANAFGDPYREDYSLLSSDQFATEDFDSFPDGTITQIPGTLPQNVSFDKQETIEPLQVSQQGRWCALRIENAQGQCDVTGVSLESYPTRSNLRRKA